MKVVLFFTLLIIAGCATTPAPKSDEELVITEVYPDKGTAMVRQDIEHMIRIYDLTPLIFTHKIEIESRKVPSRSHPVLTLNTRFAENPQKILASFIHEQLHWWTSMNRVQTLKAIAELERKFPGAPREGKNKTNKTTYEHLIVCLLEYDALAFYLDKKKATKTIWEFINRDRIYPWSYSKVLKNYATINQIILRNKLKPKILIPTQKPTKKPLLSPARRLKNL